MYKVGYPTQDRKSVIPEQDPIPPIAWSLDEWGLAPSEREAQLAETQTALLEDCQAIHPVLLRILKGQASLAEVVDVVTRLEATIMAAGGSYGGPY